MTRITNEMTAVKVIHSGVLPAHKETPSVWRVDLVDEDVIFDRRSQISFEPIEQLVKCLAGSAHERDEHVVAIAGDCPVSILRLPARHLSPAARALIEMLRRGMRGKAPSDGRAPKE